MTTYEKQIAAVKAQAAAPGVADPNGFARWRFDGERLIFAGSRRATIRKPRKGRKS